MQPLGVIAIAMIENGFVHLPKEAAWLAEYLRELTAFPKGKHDDQVDSTAQCSTGLSEPAAAPAPMPESGICIGSARRPCSGASCSLHARSRYR
jgi:hypothetical protein